MPSTSAARKVRREKQAIIFSNFSCAAGRAAGTPHLENRLYSARLRAPQRESGRIRRFYMNGRLSYPPSANPPGGNYVQMRGLPFLLLLLVAAHPPGHRGFDRVNHHQRMTTWRMGTHDGSSPHDFGRMLARREHLSAASRDRIEIQEPRRLNSFTVGDSGARLGVGFVGGHHLGMRLRSPF
jgi:hypothetical protein